MKIKTTKENNFDHTWNYFSIQWPRILVSTPGCKQLWGNPGLEWILGRRILRIPLSPRKEPWRVTRKGLLEWPLSNSFSNTNAILDWSFVPHWSLQGCSITCKKVPLMVLCISSTRLVSHPNGLKVSETKLLHSHFEFYWKLFPLNLGRL